MLDLNNKSILVTGGTGSFGKKFVETILNKWPDVKRIVVFSRDELKQYEMAQTFPAGPGKPMRYFIGDVRDAERMKMAMEGIDIVVHAAALKQVPAAEYNPMECIKTNIFGAENVVNAALSANVKAVVALSTDKAAAPINLYGATKLCSDKLFVAANNMKGHRPIKFSVVRYGNVIGSRGSVVPFFLEKRKSGTLPITHEEMTRFNISLEDGINMVLYAIEHAWGGEIFVPKIPSFKVTDLATAVAPDCKTNIIGIRPGEKLHEEMITESDSINSIELDKYFVILPSTTMAWSIDEYIAFFKGKRVPHGFKYNSGTNEEWLNVEQLREQIKLFVDPNFSI